MTRLQGQRPILLVAAILIAVLSVFSAARMAPAALDSPEVQAYLAAGGSPDDLCGLPGHATDDHRCPFCRLLSDPPPLRFAPRVLHLALVPAPWPMPADLRLGPQHGNPHVSARAPPALA